MKKNWSDYKQLNKPAKKLGLIPMKNKPGFFIHKTKYTDEVVNVTIDLTASGNDEISILKNLVKQLSDKINRLALDHNNEFNWIPDYV